MTTEKTMLSKSLIMQMFQGHVYNGGGRTNISKPFYVQFFLPNVIFFANISIGSVKSEEAEKQEKTNW